MAIVIEATHTDYERIKHLSGLVDSVISGDYKWERDVPSEFSVLLEVQEMLSDALIREVE